MASPGAHNFQKAGIGGGGGGGAPGNYINGVHLHNFPLLFIKLAPSTLPPGSVPGVTLKFAIVFLYLK